MKRLTLPSLFIVLAMLLSSCSMHLGLSKLLGSGGSKSSTNSSSNSGNSSSDNSGAAKPKHVKATHTPPSPSTNPSNGTPAAAPATGDSVTFTGGAFQPASLKVKVGTTVTWTNSDTATQSVTSDTANLFDSGVLNPGATYTFTFTQAGTFTYHSINAPTATGTIVVTP